MKRFAAFVILSFLLAACQNGNDQNATVEAQMHDTRMYHQAMQMGDYATAIAATHSLLARDTSQTRYYDTLAMLYYQSASYPQAAQVAALMLQRNPNSQKFLEIMARCYQAANKVDQATVYYEKLRQTTGDPNYDYQLANMYYSANRFDQTENYLDKIFKTPQIDTAHVKLYDNQGARQIVPLKAAALNILGSMRYKQRKPDEARQAFMQALQIDSAFMLAKDNLNNISKK